MTICAGHVLWPVLPQGGGVLQLHTCERAMPKASTSVLDAGKCHLAMRTPKLSLLNSTIRALAVDSSTSRHNHQAPAEMAPTGFSGPPLVTGSSPNGSK